MLSKSNNLITKQKSNHLASPSSAKVFRRINVDYLLLYKDKGSKQVRNTILQGVANKLLPSSTDRECATQWAEQYKKSLTKISEHLAHNLIKQNKQLPTIGLQKLSDNNELLAKILNNNPNDYLCHFQLAWLYSQSNNLALADRHFNIAALQSQTLNPLFSCFAYRHLSDVRYRAKKYSQALLAIESARESSNTFNAELQFEYVRMLSVAQRTSQALKQLTILLSKAPFYEVLAQYDPDLLDNPSIHRYLSMRRQQHQQNISNNVLLQWENDPLRLLDLDKELGQKHSLDALREKQQHTLERLPHLLIQDEATTSQLIQQQNRHFVMNTLDVRKQNYIQQIESHQKRAQRVHHWGQLLIYIMVIILMALALSYGISTLASLFSYHWPINTLVQTFVLLFAGGFGFLGMLLLHFSPRKLSRLLKQKQRLEQLTSRLGVST